MTSRVVYEDDYCAVTYDSERHLVVYRRSARSYPTLEDAARSFNSARKGIPTRTALSHHVFLMDVREGPMRADPEFEKMMRETGPHVADSFKRAAVLVKTAIGKLQMNRIRRERDAHLVVFDDESAAMAYLMSA